MLYPGDSSQEMEAGIAESVTNMSIASGQTAVRRGNRLAANMMGMNMLPLGGASSHLLALPGPRGSKGKK